MIPFTAETTDFLNILSMIMRNIPFSQSLPAESGMTRDNSLPFLLFFLSLLFLLSILFHKTERQDPGQTDIHNQLPSDLELRLLEQGFEGEIPEPFRDPITLGLKKNPVILVTDDHSATTSFEQSSIDAWEQTSHSRQCPLSRKKYEGYILNRDLKAVIEMWGEQILQKLHAKDLYTLPKNVALKKLRETAEQFTLFKQKLLDGKHKPQFSQEILYKSKTYD